MTGSDVKQAMSGKDLQAHLQRALDLLNRNQVLEAEAALEAVLKAFPEEPDALQLLGVIRRAQGSFGEAEQLYRRSLAANPDQSQVHHNLGNLLALLDRRDEAIAEQREAIRLKPNYVEAHINLGLTLERKGALTEAEKCFRKALHIQPGSMFARQSLSGLLNVMGRPKEAEAVLRQALAAGSDDPRQIAALEHNLGVSMTLQQRYTDAINLFDSAQMKVPDLPAVDYNRGNALQRLGQFDEALQSYRRALQRNPLDTLAHYDLNQLLYRMGDDENFLRSYDDAAALYPDAGFLLTDRGNFLLQKSDYEAARASFERAARLLPDNVTPLDGLGMTLANLGDFDGAIRAQEKALKLEPDNAEVWRNLAGTLLRSGDVPKSLDAVEQSLKIQPYDQGALALLGTALRLLDDPRGDALNDYESFVQVFDLDPPSGYADMESFNHELNAYLDRLHRDRREMIAQSLRGGTQTLENLFGRGHQLIDLLRERIDEAVSAYIAAMREDDTHPLLKRRRNSFSHSGSWSSRLHDCGYHTNHFHSKGWISSAYYVSLPDVIGDEKEQQGWIKFGEPGIAVKTEMPVRRAVQPRVGRLVLFPSYMWHGTVPFRSQQARTTIAFDAVPK